MRALPPDHRKKEPEHVCETNTDVLRLFSVLLLLAMKDRVIVDRPFDSLPSRHRKSAYQKVRRQCSCPSARKTKIPGSGIPLKVLFLQVV